MPVTQDHLPAGLIIGDNRPQAAGRDLWAANADAQGNRLMPPRAACHSRLLLGQIDHVLRPVAGLNNINGHAIDFPGEQLLWGEIFGRFFAHDVHAHRQLGRHLAAMPFETQVDSGNARPLQPFGAHPIQHLIGFGHFCRVYCRHNTLLHLGRVIGSSTGQRLPGSR